jgi:hypothetical protein
LLIASGLGDTLSGGGLFAVDGSAVEVIDGISSTGLAFDGRRLARSLRCTPQDGDVGEVIIYDERGVQRYLRLDDMPSIHDVRWDGDDIVVVCPWTNAVRWCSPGGSVVREARYRGAPDSRHLNCLARRGDRWYATVFGSSGGFRAWDGPWRKGAGKIIDLISGETVVNGLSAPHSPRWIDGMWLVCNSDERELVAVDEATGRVVRRVACASWTRGIAYDDDFFYVGACTRRTTGEPFGNAQIVVIDRGTWDVADRIAVPSQEIYDLLFVPQALLEGLRRGFDVNPVRVAESRQRSILSELGVHQPRSLWPSGDPLPWTDFRCDLACEMPAECTAGQVLELSLRVTNRSESFFTSAPPAPVYASYKWLDLETGDYLDDVRAFRSKLPRTVFPSETIEMTVLVGAPARAGKAILKITLMQEGVAWFDDQAAGNAAECIVEVGPAPAEFGDAAPILS